MNKANIAADKTNVSDLQQLQAILYRMYGDVAKNNAFGAGLRRLAEARDAATDGEHTRSKRELTVGLRKLENIMVAKAKALIAPMTNSSADDLDGGTVTDEDTFKRFLSQYDTCLKELETWCEQERVFAHATRVKETAAVRKTGFAEGLSADVITLLTTNHDVEDGLVPLRPTFSVDGRPVAKTKLQALKLVAVSSN
jgi:hypothetical protein